MARSTLSRPFLIGINFILVLLLYKALFLFTVAVKYLNLVTVTVFYMEQGELIKIISKVMEKERATSVRELAENLWESPDCNTSAKSLEIFKKVVKKSLEIMYARGKITKLRFKVPTGCGYTFVYGLSQEDCWNYCFKKGYAPEKLIRTLSYLLGSQGFVTNLELQELGFSFKIIKRWVEKKLIKEGNYLKVHEVLKNLKVYYLPHLEGQLDAYLRLSLIHI